MQTASERSPEESSQPDSRFPILNSLPLQMVLLAIISRLGLGFAGWYTLKLIPPPWNSSPSSIIAWAQWDAAHYARIALNGYDHPTDPGSTAFFPLYPMIVRTLGWITGTGDSALNMLIIGVLVAGVFFVIGTWFLTQLFEIHLGTRVARTAMILFLVSPFSFFLTAGYTESLFVLLVTLVFLMGHKKRWFWAAVFVALATATRVTGVFLIPTLLLMAWKNRVQLRGLAVLAAISTLGIVSYMAYTWWSLGDPLAFLSAQEGWGGFQDRTWIYVQGFAEHPVKWFLGDSGSPVMFINSALFVIWVVMLVPMTKFLPLEITVFSGLVMLQTSISIHSMGRYLIPAIGVYMVVALLIHKTKEPAFWRDVIVVPSAILMTMFFLLFAQAQWIV